MGVYLQPPRAAAIASVVWGVIDGFVSPEFLHTHHLHQLNNRTHYFKWPKYAALYALKFNLLILLLRRQSVLLFDKERDAGR